MQWLKDRLREKTTYRGLVLLLGALGLPVVPVEALELLGSAVVAGIGAVEVIAAERGTAKG